MGTPALVARKVDTGYVCMIVNFDGYLSGVGQTLRGVFNNDEEVQELIALGDCSGIMGAKSNADVVAYHRDKDEERDNVKPMHFETILSAMEFYRPIFTYVWDGDMWSAFNREIALDW